ncbi:MAG: helix-turn-helix domain-containing protein [Syntrophales bacterium]|jgi:lambda repressor-like predicted transcriptional regulator|nr:helix-turn-helix domain-containing protein [Syntrophales bacterium]MDY0044879.1 helix-turn-helix domain-containing protein [Syntrophales bacterium]
MKKYGRDFSPIEIRIAMLRKGVTQSFIARSANVSPSAIRHVIEGTHVSHKIRQAIADALEIDIKKIWPSVYLYGNGPRKAGRPSRSLPNTGHGRKKKEPF